MIFYNLKIMCIGIICWHLFCLVFSSFLGLVFDINLGKFSGTIVSNISSIPSFLPLCVCYTLCSCPTALGSSVLFFVLFSAFVFFPFQFLRILLIHRLVQRFLPQQHPIYWAHQRYHFCYGGAFFFFNL